MGKAITADVFWQRVQPGRPSECWTSYSGPAELTKDGYRRASFNGRKEYLHRVAYTLGKGRPIVLGTVRHLCDEKLCLNFRHLEDGTSAQNTFDRDARGRRTPFLPRGSQHWSAKLDDDQVRQLREARKLGVSANACAEDMGVSRSTVYAVWRRAVYGSVA